MKKYNASIKEILDRWDEERGAKTECFFCGGTFRKQSPFKDIKDSPERRINNLLPIAKTPIHKSV